jgi:hypothetical protein
LLEEESISPEELMAIPERRDDLAESLCPTCLVEYRLRAGRCVDCGVELVEFGADGSPRARTAENLDS